MKVAVVYIFALANLGLCFSDHHCNGFLRTSCQDVYTARKCGKLPECLQLWRDSKWAKYRTDVSSDCMFCLHVASSSIDARSASVLCAANPGDPPNVSGSSYPVLEKETCRNILDALYDNDSNKINDIAVCNVLRQCNSHTFIGNLNFGTTVCDDCKKIIADIKAMLADNATAEAIITKLNDLICSGIPGQLSDICKDTIRVHVKPILDLINKQISPTDICVLLGLCARPANMIANISDLLSPELFPIESVRPPQATHTPCPKETKFSWISRPSARNHPKWTSTSQVRQLLSLFQNKPSGSECVAVLEQIRTSLKDPKRQKEIKERIDKEVCDSLPSFLQTMCKNAVNEHFDEIMQHLDKVDLKQVCAAFGMPSENIDGRPSSPAYPGVCQVCEIVVARIVDLIARNITEKQVERALDAMCRLLPTMADKECEEFVEKYAAKIFVALIEGTAPKLICIGLGLCGPVASIPQLQYGLFQPLPPMRPVRDTYCDICKLVVTMVEHQLTQNETQEQVEELMKKLCSVLPAPYVQECNSLVDKYLPFTMQYLIAKLDPAEVCQVIQLCPAKQSPKLCMRGPAFWCSSPAAATYCKAEAYCESNVGSGKKHTSDCYSKTLDDICKSPSLILECGKSVECLNKQMNLYMSLLSQTARGVQYIQNCSICNKMVMRWQLHRELFGAPIVNSHTCKSFKEKADQDQCDAVLTQKDDIFALMVQGASDAEAICKSLQLCQIRQSADGMLSPSDATAPINLACAEGRAYWCASKTNAQACGTVNFCNALGWATEGEEETPRGTGFLEVEVDVFGVDACSWGPSYWCQNEDTAKRCGALDHCKKIVWQNSGSQGGASVPFVELKRPSNPCSWGPSYYCSSPEKALECGEEYAKRCWQLAKQRNHS